MHHIRRVKNDPKKMNDLYDNLNNVINKLSSTITIFGDWNAKVGTKTDLDNCMGKYSRWKRNLSGQQLIDFCEAYDYKIQHVIKQHGHKRER